MNAKGRVTSYRVVWRVAGIRFHEPFHRKAQADSFRSDLMSATKKGEAFDPETGRPVSWTTAVIPVDWYTFACSYADMKWKDASAKHRADIARVLMLATPAFFVGDRGRPEDWLIRRALSRWGYNTKQRPQAAGNVAEALGWISKSTMSVDAIADREMLLKADLDCLIRLATSTSVVLSALIAGRRRPPRRWSGWPDHAAGGRVGSWRMNHASRAR